MFLPGMPLPDGNATSPIPAAGETAKTVTIGDGEFARLAAEPVAIPAQGSLPQEKGQMLEAPAIGFEFAEVPIAAERGNRAIDLGQLLVDGAGVAEEDTVLVADPAVTTKVTPEMVPDLPETAENAPLDAAVMGEDKSAMAKAKPDTSPGEAFRVPVTEQVVKRDSAPVIAKQPPVSVTTPIFRALPSETAVQGANDRIVAVAGTTLVQAPEGEPGRIVSVLEDAQVARSEDVRGRTEKVTEMVPIRKPDASGASEVPQKVAQSSGTQVGGIRDGERSTTEGPPTLSVATGRSSVMPDEGPDIPQAQGRAIPAETTREPQGFERSGVAAVQRGASGAETVRIDVAAPTKPAPTPAAVLLQNTQLSEVPATTTPTVIVPVTPAPPATGMAMALQAAAVHPDGMKQDHAKVQAAKDGSVKMAREAEPELPRAARIDATVPQSPKPVIALANTPDGLPAAPSTQMAVPSAEMMLLPDGVPDAALDGVSGETRSGDGPARSDAVNSANRAQDLPRPAMNQILDAMRTARGSIDLTLSPEELGRVNLTLQTQDGILSVVVTAERPETADLIRRSLDLLLQEAKSEGFDDVSFGFGGSDGSGQASSEGSGDGSHRPTPLPVFETVELARPASSRLAAGGLDVRM